MIKKLIKNAAAGQVRAVIESVKPELSGGIYPVKRILGDDVKVEATIFTDGHDALAAAILYKHESDNVWKSNELEFTNKRDLWIGEFKPSKLGAYHFTIEAWVDRYGTWKHDIQKKFEADQEVTVDLMLGHTIIKQAVRKAKNGDRETLSDLGKKLQRAINNKKFHAETVKTAISEKTSKLMAKYPDKSFATKYSRELRVTVDPIKARFSSWYEFFPRSTSGKANKHGTFRDAEKMLSYIASLGFDVVYLPPIHPIGTAFRKGKNNSLTPGANDPGSPWGIGAKEGGHKSVHPQLGTLDDFRRFVKRAQNLGIEIALDIAFQCSPDHPYVKTNPEWFKKRPDGTIQYAENPPKKYQDIYPFNFETEAWPNLWKELKSVFDFWITEGVKIFRVDNPHTKSTRFWGWVINEVKKTNPEVLFLAEAFTRPAMMYHLAKIGFSQSYTYFTWRNSKKEFTDYLTELTKTELADFYRPNFWPNTPDILPGHLQKFGKPAFIARFALAGTLSSNMGIYGPVYELLENQPLHEGSEEYLNSEKYEIREWNLRSKRNIKDFITSINRIRKNNPALHSNQNLVFHKTDNEHILCYSKHTRDKSNIILTIVNLDFAKTQKAGIELDLGSIGLNPSRQFIAKELLTGSADKWNGTKMTVSLNPNLTPVAIFCLNQRSSKKR